MTGKVNKSKLINEIKINLKTLYGDRKKYEYLVRIDDKISTIVKNLIEDELKVEEKDPKKKWNKNYQYRLVSSVGNIKEVAPTKSFYQEGIKNGQTLILASPLKLTFSETKHGQGILIQNNNSLAYKQNGDEHEYAISNRGYNSGVNYCEFTLETEPDERNIIIGLTLSRTDFYFANESKGFWGFVPSE